MKELQGNNTSLYTKKMRAICSKLSTWREFGVFFYYISGNIAMRGQSSINSQRVNMCSENADNLLSHGKRGQFAKVGKIQTIC